MFKGTLFRRLIPPLVVVIAVLTVVVTLVGSWMMQDALTDRAKRRARSLSTVERDGILRLMRAGNHSDLQRVLEEMGRSPDIETVRILDPDSAVLASSRPHETGRQLPDHLVQNSARGDVKPGLGQTSIRSHPIVHVVQPFGNSSECQSCHREAGSIVAWLDMDVEVNEHAIGFATFNTLSAALGGLYLLAAIAIVVPTLTSFVVGPMRRLTAAMSQVQLGGDVVSMAPTGTREVDTVVEGFNRMVVDLRQGRAAEEEARRLHLERVEQLAVVGELAAGLAHEVRNPVSGVKAVLDVLTREAADETRKRVLRDASGELVRIDRILRELLQFARPKPPTLSPFDFSALVRDAVSLTFQSGDNQPKVKCSLADALPPALGDASQVRQVLVNLLLNAQHAATGAGEVVVSTGRREGYLWCSVQDDGLGIALDRAEAIFRPFVTSKTRGTGLGLSISRRIIELHGGRLALDNPGVPGASFTFTVPMAPASVR